ncbi:class I SAM-dependent methyltransferase [Dyadobacter frigoris]|uniref:class I SAM-dependent methyltransferase n=1 Tax=Dyadobacter frigoris TaxID=2576211 RepID=UPI001C7034A8|nr:class I SAM-dependent methyltransferase [Dyadobacter frigoris]GLU53372.1 hypothetical protein Dfri01_28330 [Dyadobacter frigoris]
MLDNGFEHITVLDISEKALEKARIRLGEKAGKVNRVVSDITEFEPDTTFIFRTFKFNWYFNGC